MNFYYVNHENEKIDFSDFPYRFQEGDLLDWVYSYQTSQVGVKNKTRDYRRDVSTPSVQIGVGPDYTLPPDERQSQWREDVNHLADVMEKDVIAAEDGKLWTDTGYYLRCKIIGSSKSDWTMGGIPFMFNEFQVLCDNPMWIKEYTRQFYPAGTPGSGTSGDFLDFPFDFSFDFSAPESGVESWNIDNYASNDFKMTIYGPCENPRILINGWPYEVTDTLESGEYIVIDSAANTVIKYRTNGTTKDLFNDRGKLQSVFTPIPGGRITVNWSGTFRFDITIYAERTEPRW